MTEFLKHGYVVALVPRQGRPPEVIIRAPYGVDVWWSMRDVERWIGQLTRELEVMQAAKALLAKARDQ